MSALLVLVLFADVSVAAPPVAARDGVASVRLESGWVGLGTPATVVVNLVRTARGFSDGKRDVDSALVAGLRARLRAPAVRALPSRELSSIVAKLLPPGAVNRLRLDGARFRAPSSLP